MNNVMITKTENTTSTVFLHALWSLLKAGLLSFAICLPVLGILAVLTGQEFESPLLTLVIGNLVHVFWIGFSLKFLPASLPSLQLFRWNGRHFLIALGLYGLLQGVVYLLRLVIQLPVLIGPDDAESVATGGWMFFISVCIFTPILEEVLYRGVFLEYLLQHTTPGKAILYSAFFFGLTHVYNLDAVWEAALAGLVLGYVYYRFRSLLIPMLLHLIHNMYTYWSISNTLVSG